MFNFIKNFIEEVKDNVDLPDYISHNGFRFLAPRPTDWIAGKETGIAFENRNPSGDWTDFLPTPELQRFKFESFSCVTFGGHHVLTCQLNWLLKNNKFSATDLKFFNDNGYIVDGKFNLNEIFNVAQNGTTQEGNYMVNYWDNVRKVGVVPQKAWTQLEDCYSWWDMKKTIPKSVSDLGLEFLKYVDIKYEWVLTNRKNDQAINEALTQSPLQIATPVCPTWGTGDVKACATKELAHCTMIYDVDGYYKILDQYDPFFKKLSPNYYIPCAIKAVVTPKNYTPPPPPPMPKYKFETVMEYGEKSEDIKQLQTVLKALGYFKLEPTGYYGDVTRQAVLQFQIDRQVAFPSELNNLQGKRCGLKTLTALNKITN
jgi:hypothetical protein